MGRRVKKMSKKTVNLLLIMCLILPALMLFSGTTVKTVVADGDGFWDWGNNTTEDEGFNNTIADIYVMSVYNGKVGKIGTNYVEYTGGELIMKMMVSGDTFNTVGTEGSVATIKWSEIYTDKTKNLFIYRVSFLKGFTDGDLVFYAEDNRRITITYNVTNAGYVLVDGDLYEMYEDAWEDGERNIIRYKQVTGYSYPNTVEGHNNAWNDAIDEAEAIRAGAGNFLQNMMMALVMHFLDPYFDLWFAIIIMLLFVRDVRRSEIIRKLRRLEKQSPVEKRREDIARKVITSKKQGLLQQTDYVASMLGIPWSTAKYISNDYSTLGMLSSAFDETRINPDARDTGKYMEGKIADTMFKWMREIYALDKNRTNIGEKYKSLMTSLGSLMTYIVVELGYKRYIEKIHMLNKITENWQNVIAQTIEQYGKMAEERKKGEISRVRERISIRPRERGGAEDDIYPEY